METIEEKIKKLPPDLKKEVEDFVDFLLEKMKKKTGKKLKLDWAGGLKEYKDKYTSLELQKKSLNGGETECVSYYFPFQNGKFFF